MAALRLGSLPPPTLTGITVTKKCERFNGGFKVVGDGGGDSGFPPFLPKEIEKIKDPFARNLARRIKRLPVQVSKWRRAYPLLEESGLEAWALDILGWGFSDLGSLPPCNVASKRYHLHQLWKSYIKRPMVLVGPSLGAAVAIDFAVNYPEAVEKLVLINPSVYAEGTGNLAKLPKVVAYAGVSLLKTFPLRLYANLLAFDGIPLSKSLDWTNVGRLHCHMPWWKDATVNFMVSGGYNVVSKIKQVKQKTLIICGENDKIVSNQLAMRLRFELPNASMQRLPDSGHLCHVDKPQNVVKLIVDFAQAK
ncbi:monoacylglycerol lipase ABHD6 [Gossypium australe]|uniref:Monoacylglycerol lipase ABHD6 n=1 Tax=Gossypium australe TaxID=47621 RepID=A0A5B6UE63_9ROSI|nr:monoacylglycerol lipase ABHD6 [Gossypium australe]